MAESTSALDWDDCVASDRVEPVTKQAHRIVRFMMFISALLLSGSGFSSADVRRRCRIMASRGLRLWLEDQR